MPAVADALKHSCAFSALDPSLSLMNILGGHLPPSSGKGYRGFLKICGAGKQFMCKAIHVFMYKLNVEWTGFFLTSSNAQIIITTIKW